VPGPDADTRADTHANTDADIGTVIDIDTDTDTDTNSHLLVGTVCHADHTGLSPGAADRDCRAIRWPSSPVARIIKR
jgi:hypothetical protein